MSKGGEEPRGNSKRTRAAATSKLDAGPATDPDLTRNEPVRVLGGDFELLRMLGKGGMGEVWLAKQRSLARQVAVKVLPANSTDPTYVERFQREARAAAQLVHPNVIQVYSFGVEEGSPFFAMELIEGEDLQQRMARTPDKQLELSDVLDIMIKLASALDMAHEQGVIHRDIKPSNIMLDKRGNVKVMDFGLAKAIDSAESQSLTHGMILGTPNYISPEQGSGHPVDGRADLYSAGVVLYELLTGTRPFRADSAAALIVKHIYDLPPHPLDLRPDLPPRLVDIALRLLEKDRELRHPTARALMDELTALDPETFDLAELGKSGGTRRNVLGTTRQRRAAKLDETTEPSSGPEAAPLTPRPPTPSRPSAPAPPPPSRVGSVLTVLTVVALLAAGGLIGAHLTRPELLPAWLNHRLAAWFPAATPVDAAPGTTTSVTSRSLGVQDFRARVARLRVDKDWPGLLAYLESIQADQVDANLHRGLLAEAQENLAAADAADARLSELIAHGDHAEAERALQHLRAASPGYPPPPAAEERLAAAQAARAAAWQAVDGDDLGHALLLLTAYAGTHGPQDPEVTNRRSAVEAALKDPERLSRVMLGLEGLQREGRWNEALERVEALRPHQPDHPGLRALHRWAQIERERAVIDELLVALDRGLAQGDLDALARLLEPGSRTAKELLAWRPRPRSGFTRSQHRLTQPCQFDAALEHARADCTWSYTVRLPGWVQRGGKTTQRLQLARPDGRWIVTQLSKAPLRVVPTAAR